MWAGAVTTGGFSEPPASIVYVAGSRASVGGVEVVLDVLGLVGVGRDVPGTVGGDVSGTVGGAAVAVRGAVGVVEERETVDELLLDRDPPHPAAVNSRTDPERSAIRFTFAG